MLQGSLSAPFGLNFHFLPQKRAKLLLVLHKIKQSSSKTVGPLSYYQRTYKKKVKDYYISEVEKAYKYFS